MAANFINYKILGKNIPINKCSIVYLLNLQQ